MENRNRHRLKYTCNIKSRVPPKNMNNCTKTGICVASPTSTPPLHPPIFSTPTPINSH